MSNARIVAVAAAHAVAALCPHLHAQTEPAAPAPAVSEPLPNDSAARPDTASPPASAEAATPAPAPAQPSSLDAAAPVAPAPAVLLPSASLPSGPAASPLAPIAPAAPQEPGRTEAETAPKADTVLAEDWWSHTRPILEIHGYFRTRAELFHHFTLGRRNSPSSALWAAPADNQYRSFTDDWGPALCSRVTEAGQVPKDCENVTQSSANLRFRLNPELHVSDNLRVISQIDILDNLVLGSTPNGYANTVENGRYSVVARSGYTPLAFFDDSTEPPSAGVNGTKDSLRVKRAWAEYGTPVGQLRFGRMPDHFGLGMYHNAGDGYDDDYQSTIDRLMFITNLRPLDLYIGASWDFPSEGATSESFQLPGAQAYDIAQLDDVDQYSLLLLRKKDPELQKLLLTRGELVLNAGAYLTYRTQTLANDRAGTCAEGDDASAAAVNCPSWLVSTGYVRREASAVTPDLWLQLLYKQFRFELEAVTVQGTIENSSVELNDYTSAPGGEGWRLSAWGLATQLEQRLLEDRLELGFGFGWASGDPDVDKLGADTLERGDLGLTPGSNGLQRQRGDDTMSTFRFHPSYGVDLILHRNLLSRVQGTYYFRPSIAYDFMRKSNGQRLGGSFAGIWSRASEYVQAPGHERDLGIELNGSLYFQSKDGVLNDRPGVLGGFFTKLDYGVLFPLDGLGYPADLDRTLNNVIGPRAKNLSTAQILRLYLGVFF